MGKLTVHGDCYYIPPHELQLLLLLFAGKFLETCIHLSKSQNSVTRYIPSPGEINYNNHVAIIVTIICLFVIDHPHFPRTILCSESIQAFMSKIV